MLYTTLLAVPHAQLKDDAPNVRPVWACYIAKRLIHLFVGQVVKSIETVIEQPISKTR